MDIDRGIPERGRTAQFDLREPLLGDVHGEGETEASPSVFRNRGRSVGGRHKFTRTTSELPVGRAPELGGREAVSIPVLFARVAAKCGQELLDKVDAVDCHAAFDATLEHACRLYETVCYENLAADSPAAQGFQFVGDKPLRRESPSRWTGSGTDADLGGQDDGQDCGQGHSHGHGHGHSHGGGARGRHLARETSHALHADPEEHGGAGDEHGADEGHGHGGGGRGGEGHHPRFRRQNSLDTNDGELPAVMSKEALAKALEHEGFHGLMAEPAFDDLWDSLGQEAIDVSTFHTVLRLLKLHLLCGVLHTDPDYESRLVPLLEEETGLVRVLDWNARSIDEMSFEKSSLTDMFLTHRRSKMKMRWVHCAQVGRLTLCRLAVKYQLHPLPVEDSIKLGNQSMPVVRKYGNNFFLVIPMLRLSTRSKEMLECYRETTSKGWAADIKESVGRQRCSTDFATPPMQAKGSDSKRAQAEVSGPCVVEVEQGRLALFVSGPPNYDTVISVQTKWLLRHLESGGSHFDPGEEPHNPGRRRLTPLRSRVERLLARLAGRGKKLSRDMDADMVPAMSSRMRSFPFSSGSGSDPGGFSRQASPATTCGEEEEYMGTEPFDLVAQEVRKDFSVLRAGNASWLLWRLLDVCVDELTPILAAYRARLQWFSAYIAKQRAKASLDVEKQLLRSKVELDWLQRKARPMVRIVRHLVRERAIESDVTRYIEDVEDHLETFIEEMSRSMGVCDSLREQVRSYRDRQQQSVLYVLAIVTTLFTPMQLLTGVYGMNWQDPDGLPVVPGFGPLKDDRGWYLFWGLGTLIVASLYLTFRLILKWI